MTLAASRHITRRVMGAVLLLGLAAGVLYRWQATRQPEPGWAATAPASGAGPALFLSELPGGGAVPDLAQPDPATVRAAQAMLATPLYQGVPDPHVPGLDAYGRLVINQTARDLFEHYLLGDQSAQRQVARYLVGQAALKQWAQAKPQDSARALSELDSLFTRYVAMLNHLREHAPQFAGDADRLAMLQQTRVQFLTEPVAQAMFGAQEAADRAATLRRDQGLVAQATGDALQKEVATFDQAGLSVEARYEARVKAHGKVVAERWLLVDRQAHERKLALQAFVQRWHAAGKPAPKSQALEAMLAELGEGDQDIARALAAADGFDAYLATLP